MPRKKLDSLTRDPLAAARATARKVVARQWPELADVEPLVTERSSGAGQPKPGAPPANGAAEQQYIFTFAADIRTPEGYTMPRVARVTVDSRQRVLKVVTSK